MKTIFKPFWRKQVYIFRVLPSLLKTLFIAMMFYFSGRILLNVYLLLLSMCINGEEFLLLFIQKEKKQHIDRELNISLNARKLFLF